MRGLLLDLDGTVYQEGHAIPGAAEALAELRRRGVPFRFTTNTARRPRAALAERLRSMGIPAETEEILAVVGDDLESDVAGARQSGMIGVAVRTGKYRPQDEDRAQAAADVVLDSIADLPGWLGA